MADAEPAAPRGEPYVPPVREPWTPGAGWARLQREHPELIPDVITDEDYRIADEIIAAADRQDELRRRRGAGPS